jgi:hypothetical protein
VVVAGVWLLILTTCEIDEYGLKALSAGAGGFLGMRAWPCS